MCYILDQGADYSQRSKMHDMLNSEEWKGEKPGRDGGGRMLGVMLGERSER